MINLKDIVDAVVDMKGVPSQYTIYETQGSIYPVIDYRLEDVILHLINFRSNDYLEDIITLEELLEYIEVEGFELEAISIPHREFELVEDRILLYY